MLQPLSLETPGPNQTEELSPRVSTALPSPHRASGTGRKEICKRTCSQRPFVPLSPFPTWRQLRNPPVQK